jgi:hypothetical protein
MDEISDVLEIIHTVNNDNLRRVYPFSFLSGLDLTSFLNFIRLHDDLAKLGRQFPSTCRLILSLDLKIANAACGRIFRELKVHSYCFREQIEPGRNNTEVSPYDYISLDQAYYIRYQNCACRSI